MAILESLEFEWERLWAKKREIEQKILELRDRLNYFLETDDVLALIKEKERLLGEVDSMRCQIDRLKSESKRSLYWHEVRQRALLDSKVKKYLDQKAKRRSERLRVFEATNAPSSIVETERRMVWECTAPITEVEKKVAEYQQKIQEVELARQTLNEEIRKIDDCRRSKKRSLESLIQENENLARQCKNDLVEWVEQDEEHRAWTFEHHPDLHRLYGIHSPTSTPPAPTVSVVPLPTKKENGDCGPAKKIDAVLRPQAQPWKFFITFDENSRGVPLPNKQDEFVKEVCPILNGAKLYQLKGELLHQKLMEVVRKSIHQRQKMNQIYGNKMFHGWKKMNVGGFYRVLLKFDEGKRIVWFSPQTHEVYKKIRRG